MLPPPPPTPGNSVVVLGHCCCIASGRLRLVVWVLHTGKTWYGIGERCMGSLLRAGVHAGALMSL